MRSNRDNLQILFEDNHIIVVNKRCGDIVQGDKTMDIPLSEIVKSYIKRAQDKLRNVFLGVVHRLDRPTSGIVIFAKTSKALNRFNKMLRDRDIEKIYWAIVERSDIPNEQVLENFLIKNSRNNKSSICSSEISNAKKAVLHYKVLRKIDRYQLLEIRLETGRHHQIRVQLANLDCFVKGDLKYGAKRSNKLGGISLHARKVRFIHPVKGQELSLIAPTPDGDIWESIEVQSQYSL